MTNIILEGFLCKSCKKKGPMRKWLKNFSRSMVLGFAIVIAMYYLDDLTQILALSGTILGTSVVMTIPTLSHYYLCAETKYQKLEDIAIIVFSIGINMFCTSMIIA